MVFAIHKGVAMYRVILILLLLTSTAYAEVYTQATAKYPPDKDHKERVLRLYDANTTTEAYLKCSQEQKAAIIQDGINRYRAQGVDIKLSAYAYVDIIDNVLVKNPDYIGVPLKQIFEEILEAEGSLPKEE